jgi:hypothetical protein
VPDHTPHDNAETNRNGNDEARAPDGSPLPERRLMADGLPDWDLEPPTNFIRRGQR